MGSNNDELLERVVLIHPELTTDPADMRGRVGKVIEDNDQYLTVSFPAENIKAKYTYEGVVALKTYKQMLDYLLQSYDDIKYSDKRIILGAMKMQAEGRESLALALLSGYPDALSACTLSCSEIKDNIKHLNRKQNRKGL